jgi:hypothetical protein
MIELPEGYIDTLWFPSPSGRICGMVVCKDPKDGLLYCYVGQCLACTDLDSDFIYKKGHKLSFAKFSGFLDRCGEHG